MVVWAVQCAPCSTCRGKVTLRAMKWANAPRKQSPAPVLGKACAGEGVCWGGRVLERACAGEGVSRRGREVVAEG